MNVYQVDDRRFSIWLRILAMGIVTMLAPVSAGAFAQDVKSVTAIGRAARGGAGAKEKACDEAKRQAVAQACGERINAYTNVEDFAVKKDRILANAVGYVTEFRKTREWDEGDESLCEIAATVSTGKFASDWEAMFAHIRHDMGNPRCALIVVEDNDMDDPNPAKPNGICQSRLESHFLKNDVKLADKGVIEQVVQRDVDLAMALDDVRSMATRAASFGVDVLIVGRAEAKRGGTVPIGGRPTQRWDVSLTVRAVLADSGDMLVSEVYRPEKSTLSTSAGSGDSAFEKLADEVGPKLLRSIGENWRKRLTSFQIIPVIFDGCSRSDFRKRIQPVLLGVEGVKLGEEGIKIREAVEGTVTVDVYWSFDLDKLADAIEDLTIEGMSFEVYDQSNNRVRARVHLRP
ncbi:MAG: hypothetical protein AABZ12_09945 [Planctomycetota bacterium]